VLFAALEESPYVKAFKPSGAFYIWAHITPDWPGYQGKTDDWSMTNFLIDQAGIGSAPGSAFGPDNESYIRFAFSCSTDQVRAAAELLPSALRAAKA
jgi:aspartate aminotransferase